MEIREEDTENIIIFLIQQQQSFISQPRMLLLLPEFCLGSFDFIFSNSRHARVDVVQLLIGLDISILAGCDLGLT